MAGTIIDPMATTSATPDPESEPNSIQAAIITMARPPVPRPTMAAQKATMRGARPPCTISVPANRNSGMASSVKLSIPATMRCATIIRGARSEIIR